MPLIQFGQFDPLLIETTRITEVSDTRITEAGDIRITNDIASNNGISSIVADPTLIPLARLAYVNDNGTWKSFVPYVKHIGNWKLVDKIYKNVSGQWRRVY